VFVYDAPLRARAVVVSFAQPTYAHGFGVAVAERLLVVVVEESGVEDEVDDD